MWCDWGFYSLSVLGCGIKPDASEHQNQQLARHSMFQIEIDSMNELEAPSMQTTDVENRSNIFIAGEMAKTPHLQVSSSYFTLDGHYSKRRPNQ
jgi:hypothetical protein